MPMIEQNNRALGGEPNLRSPTPTENGGERAYKATALIVFPDLRLL
jgi:hypothetical protein